MSELREELLGGGVNKKRVLGVILVAVILISVFAFSTFFISLLFGSQRINPNKNKKDTDYEFAELIAAPYPFDEDFWKDLLDQIDPADIPALLDMLSEMFDGDIDDLDLRDFSQALMALLAAGAGEMEVFRVYDYLDFGNMSDVLWKYESFDQYTGDGWTSTAGSDMYSFFTYQEWIDNYSPDPEILKIRLPISPNLGINSMVLPSLFPTPNIMEGKGAPPYPDAITDPNSNLDPLQTQLYKTDFNSTTVDIYFNPNVDTNITYFMFGLNLPTDSEINNSAVEASWTPAPIKAKYLQLPPDISTYKSNNPYFTNHTLILNATISGTDNAFEVADKIRIYLQTQFSVPLNPGDYNPAPEGRDVVDWFSETQQGLWSDFASAFCAFTRAFGVSSRYIDGFHSLMVEEFLDDGDGVGFAVKYKNLYSWAEIYVPTDISGNGNWVQLDVFDSFAPGGNPLLGGNYNITVSAFNATRPSIVNITASMSSDIGDPIVNNTLTFTDLTTGQEINSSVTDALGNASVLYNLNNSHVVGPHIIEARYDFFTAGYNISTILGNIKVNLTTINPQVINRSDGFPDTINVQGTLYDPLNGQRVEDASVTMHLFQIGTSLEEFGAFSPSSIITDSNGNFNDNLDINPSVSAGQYEVRADFNGSWQIGTPLGVIPYFIPSITNSSNRIELNLTTALTTWFYIDGSSTSNPNLPSVSRYQILNLTAQVILEGFGPMSNEMVNFYDHTLGGIQIGSDTSDINGFASINYTVGFNSLSGPNLLYSRIGPQSNYSYYILNEEPTINAITGPTPRVINRTGGGATQFNIVGDIVDTTNLSPLSFSEIALKLIKGGTDYSSFLVPLEVYPYQTDTTGTFDLTFGVAPNTPPGNYSLRLDFNGSIDLTSYPYPYLFNLSYINTSTYYSFELKIDSEASVDFWINGIPSNDAFNPEVYRNDSLNLTAFVHYGGVPVADGEWVDFYDITQDNLFIGSDTTIGGYAQVFYNTNLTTTAGPHLIYATWSNRFNYSYFIYDAPISVNLDICPLPREINRTGAIDINFAIHGYLNDTLNGNPIKFSEIEVFLFDGITDVSFYLNLETGSLQLDETGEIDLTYSVLGSTPAKNYTLEVLVNGIFIYTNPVYPQFFDIWYLGNFTNFANGIYELKVKDPDDIDIFFFIDGNPTLSFYSDGQPPERYNGGELINFSVYITQGGSPVNFGTVSFTDVYTGNPLGTQPVVLGNASILINSTSWHGGLHRIRAQWSGSATLNITYVIINKTASIFGSSNKASILRNLDNFITSGTVQENAVLLRGLRVNLVLLDSGFNDVSGFLTGPQSFTTNTFGYFQFDNSVSITCPQGQYYIRIDFNGTISAPGIFMSDYMVHNSSVLIPIDIIAGTSLNGNYETKVVTDDWYFGDDCYVYGNLNWDNGTQMAFMEINVTIRDGFGAILATQTGFTDGLGFFNITFTVGDWLDDTEVWVYFFPEDIINFGIPDGLYVLSLQQEFFRAP